MQRRMVRQAGVFAAGMLLITVIGVSVALIAGRERVTLRGASTLSNYALATATIRTRPTGFFEGWFVSPTTGWMVTRDHGRATLSRTDDGGSHWRSQLPLQYPKLFQRDMSFLDENIGFVVVRTVGKTEIEPRLLATNDGGQHWLPRSLPGQGAVGGMDFSSSTDGWVLESSRGGVSILYYTRDGGNTWSRCGDGDITGGLKGVDPMDHLEGVRFSDGMHGWIAGWKSAANTALPLYYYTEDGCATWRVQNLPRAQSQAGNEHVVFVDPPARHDLTAIGGVVVSQHVPRASLLSIFTSVDETGEWSETVTTASQNGIPLWGAFGANRAAALGDPGLVRATGASVSTSSVNSPLRPFAVQFINGDVAVAEAEQPDTHGQVLLRTADGGRTWTMLVSLSTRS